MTPEQKAQRLREGIEAFVRQDMEKVAEVIGEDVKWHEPPGTKVGGDYNGRDDVFNRLFSTVPRDWAEFAFDVHSVLSDGEHTVALLNWQGRSKHTGKVYTDHVVLTTHMDDDGVIRESWAAWNTVQLKEALGEGLPANPVDYAQARS